MHNTTRVTPMDGVSTSNTGTTLHKQDMHEARPIRPFTIATYRATVLRFLAHRSLPVTSRYYRTMLGVSVPAENLIKPT